MSGPGAVPRVSVIMPVYLRRAVPAPGTRERARADLSRHRDHRHRQRALAEIERLVRSYGDPRLRYRHNGGNIGPMSNAMAAYADARGAYITNLHDDDVWEPTYLARLVPALEADDDLNRRWPLRTIPSSAPMAG